MSRTSFYQMASGLLKAATVLCLGAVIGCASLEKYDTAVKEFPQLETGQGRIFFYRDKAFLGNGTEAIISLNGEAVGKSQSGGFFFVDRPTGDYRIGCRTSGDSHHEIAITLAPKETKYVRTVAHFTGMDWNISPVLEDRARAMKTLPRSWHEHTVMDQ